MAATVTIDKAYFETLLRRAELHTSGRDLTTPVNIPIVSIPKVDHDNLLRMAQEYTSLKGALLNAGIGPDTLEILIRGENVPPGGMDSLTENDDQSTGGASLFTRPSKTHVAMSRPPGNSYEDSNSKWLPAHSWGGDPGYSKAKGVFYSRNNSSGQDDGAFTPDFERDDGFPVQLRAERQQFARAEQRTIIVKNLSDRATHRDIVDFIRGGLVLDIYLRSNERSASISFVEGSSAQEFMAYVKRNDIYVHGKRLEFNWNDRQFILPGHVANKIGIGATRNLVIRGVHPNITEERIREDLDHIHNLVIIGVAYQNGDAHIELNSIHNSLFARTCMMSRAVYKGTRIEWYPDECAQPLPKMQYLPKKENIPAQPVKNTNLMVNRFQMLNMDGDGTEDGSEEEKEPTLSDMSSLHVRRNSPWNPRTVAA